MSSSYYILAKARTRLETLLQTTATASFHDVRVAYFSYSLDTAPARARQRNTYQTMAFEFANSLQCNVLKTHKPSLEQKTQWTAEIEVLLQKPGTPYERVGYVLDWFKTTRAQLRTNAIKNGRLDAKKIRFDTSHGALQNSMGTLLENLCYRMLADEPQIDPEQFNQWTRKENHSRKQTCGGFRNNEIKSATMQKSESIRNDISTAPPWAILLDWNWRTSLRVDGQTTPLEAKVPPTYVLAQYLLRATPETFSREHALQAMIVEQVHYDTNTRRLQSGAELGIPIARPVSDYDAWWKKEEKRAARDWRHIRRSEVVSPTSHSAYIRNATLGDAMARLRKLGPADIVKGALSYAEPEVKALLLNRLQSGLGTTYTALKQVEDAVGPMPESMIQTLNEQLQKVETIEMGLSDLNLF